SSCTFDAWLRQLPTKIQELSFVGTLAFATSCCERAVPNYRAFSRAENWGDPKLLTDALEFLWLCVMKGRSAGLTEQVTSLVKAVEIVTPETESFKSGLTSAALDAASSIAEALEFSADAATEHIVTICSLSRDTIDLFIQQRDDVHTAGPELLQKSIDS